MLTSKEQNEIKSFKKAVIHVYIFPVILGLITMLFNGHLTLVLPSLYIIAILSYFTYKSLYLQVNGAFEDLREIIELIVKTFAVVAILGTAMFALIAFA